MYTLVEIELEKVTIFCRDLLVPAEHDFLLMREYQQNIRRKSEAIKNARVSEATNAQVWSDKGFIVYDRNKEHVEKTTLTFTRFFKPPPF